jgi:hypothetical protein
MAIPKSAKGDLKYTDNVVWCALFIILSFNVPHAPMSYMKDALKQGKQSRSKEQDHGSARVASRL